MLIVNTSKQQPSIFNFLTKKNRNDKDFRYCISCWRNDKFSFNGHEPVGFTGPLDSIAKQDAIADQGNSAVPQYLTLGSTHGDDDFEVTITYIDQNNA